MDNINSPAEIKTSQTGLPIKDYEDLNFLLLVIGRIITALVSGIFTFALSLYILDITGSPALFSLVMAAGIIPNVFVNIFAGVFIDKSNKKNVMIFADFLSAIIIFIFWIVFNVAQDNVYIFVAYSLIFNTIRAFFTLAINASVTNFVSMQKVVKLNSALQSINPAANVIGPVLGAILYKMFGLSIVIFINGIILLSAGIIEIFLIYKKNTNGNKKKFGYFKDLKYTFQYLKELKILAFFFIFAVVINFIYNPLIFVVLRFINYKIIKISEFQLSIIQASSAIGIILGSIFLSSFKALNNKMIRKFIFLFLIQALLIIFWVFPEFFMKKNFGQIDKWIITFIFSLLLLLYGILNTFQNIPVLSYFQLKIPEDLKGRVFGVFFTSLYISTPLGMWLYGIILEYISWSIVICISGILMIIGGIIASRNKYFKEFVANDDLN